MSAGLQANLAGDPADAEKAYRAALSLQEKQQGADSPAGAAAMMSVALQLSDQGQFDDAKNFFLRAEKALRSPGGTELDVNGQARLALYLGLDALNQNDPKLAIKRFTEAETGFREQEPDAPDVPTGAGDARFASGGLSLAALSRRPTLRDARGKRGLAWDTRSAARSRDRRAHVWRHRQSGGGQPLGRTVRQGQWLDRGFVHGSSVSHGRAQRRGRPSRVGGFDRSERVRARVPDRPAADASDRRDRDRERGGACRPGAPGRRVGGMPRGRLVAARNQG